MKKETTPEEQQQNKRIGLIAVAVIIVLALIFGKSSPSPSSSSSSSNTHTCTWCGKSYSGNGYNHLGGSGASSYCAEATNGWEKKDQCCSMKCCEEQSKSN